MTIITCFLLSVLGIYSIDYVPPPDGIGSEILPFSPRSFGMGGVTAAIREERSFSMLNPAASSWSTTGSVCFSSRYSESDDAAWDNSLGFPMMSALVPLPGRIVLTAAIDGRSRIDSGTEEMVSDNYMGEFTWDGGLVETYAGASFRATDWLGVSLGGRCTFGNIMSDVTLITTDTLPLLPENSVYRDDARFRMAWGAVIGIMVSTDRFGAGFSVSTDRKGDLDVDRQFSIHEETDSSSTFYTIPGEMTLGVSFRPLDRILLGFDLYSRKSLNILGSRTDRGSVYSAGAEVTAAQGILARCGYSYMDGLWCDGSQTFTLGAGYSFADESAGLDLALGYRFWRDLQDSFLDETVFSISLWASEQWLGD